MFDFLDGNLRKLDPVSGNITMEKFAFKVKDDNDFNQKHYEALGEVLTISRKFKNKPNSCNALILI